VDVTVENWQLLAGINTILLAVLGFFIKSWVTKLEKRLDGKIDVILCGERHGSTEKSCDILFHHRHAPVHPDGRGGEVITS